MVTVSTAPGLDTTDVEVYGGKKRGVAYNHQGQRVGRPHVATWAEAETVLAADLGDTAALEVRRREVAGGVEAIRRELLAAWRRPD